MRNQRGFILLMTFMFMVVIAAMVGMVLYMATSETKDVTAQLDDLKMLNLAEAGAQRALREIRDDVLTTTQNGTADIRGDDTSGSVSVSSVDRIKYIDSSTASINDNGDIALLRTFDVNYSNARIKTVLLCVRASRANGGTGATIEVSYTTNGAFPQVGNTVLTQILTTFLSDYSVNITADRSWTWSTIMSANFILRAVRTTGNRDINLDALYLRITYEIDTNTEAWSTGTYDVFPKSLGEGTIEAVTITAEQGKVHLNTASQALLRYLMEERGITSATADSLANNIITYRTTNWFDAVEEVQQTAGMTTANYDLIKDYVTVYSYINTYAQRPAASRAPININTAPREVLEAVFDALSLGGTDPASLATDIINQRVATPFSCFYSSSAAVTSDFYDFVISRGYLSSAGNPDEQDRVLDNADASSLIPVSGSTGYNAVTAEFSYDSNTFKVESLADVYGRQLRVKAILGDDGSQAFTTYSGDASSAGYRAENFE